MGKCNVKKSVEGSDAAEKINFVEAFLQTNGGPNSNKSMSQKVYDHIIRKIYLQEVEWGRRITEADLAKEIGVSTAPVREALVRLQHDGWIESYPNQGSYLVNYYHPEKYRQTMLLRKAMEIGVFYQLARVRTSEQLREMGNIIEQMEHALTEKDYLMYRHGDTAFHLSAALFVGGQRLRDFYEPLLLQCFILSAAIEQGDQIPNIHSQGAGGTISAIKTHPMQQSYEAVLAGDAEKTGERSHREIYEALEAGDAARAALSVAEHFSGSRYGYDIG